MCEAEKSIRISLVRERLATVGSRDGEDEENENHFGKARLTKHDRKSSSRSP